MVEENSCEYDSLHFYMCYVMLCCVMLCYVMLCYVMLSYDFLLDVEFSSLFCEQTTQSNHACNEVLL